MAALNINVFDIPNFSITTIYNDTAQHSLPIIINLINNAVYRCVAGGCGCSLFDLGRLCCRLVMLDRYPGPETVIQPIELKTQPFQQTSQPEEFNIGICSSAVFIGMIFVLVPVSLSIDMVYDREVSLFF